MMKLPPDRKLEWRITPGLTNYAAAVAEMEARVEAIRRGEAAELVWLVEHPPLYTAGTSSKESDLIQPRFPVYATGRGGQYTYHGPGQRVGYVMVDLKARDRADLRRYVHDLEEWVIRALARFNLTAVRREGRVGLWIELDKHGGLPGTEAKIGAIGVRVRRWVAYHGVAINLDPDLSHFTGIVPCGIRDHGVTSLVALGYPVTMADLDVALRQSWTEVFGDAPASA
jgi:lipoyl(octanoyl) transferase